VVGVLRNLEPEFGQFAVVTMLVEQSAQTALQIVA
jgi:hypothetical protein